MKCRCVVRALRNRSGILEFVSQVRSASSSRTGVSAPGTRHVAHYTDERPAHSVPPASALKCTAPERSTCRTIFRQIGIERHRYADALPHQSSRSFAFRESDQANGPGLVGLPAFPPVGKPGHPPVHIFPGKIGRFNRRGDRQQSGRQWHAVTPELPFRDRCPLPEPWVRKR